MKNVNKTSAIILAAGKGTRMKSELPKVLHEVCGKPMIMHIIDTLKMVGISDIIVVVGHKAEMVRNVVGDGVKYALQAEQKGTGHAVMQTTSFLNEKGNTLIVAGDTPLIEQNTLFALIDNHIRSGNKGTVLSAEFNNPFGYGRIIRDYENNVSEIIEEKDATELQREIREVNTGIFCFDNESLLKGLSLIENNNAQNEYYLTDMVCILNKLNQKFGSYLLSDNEQVLGINDREQLTKAEYIMTKKRKLTYNEGLFENKEA
ncbi:sugar phosphate nucleotidyltransferase [Bacillus mexicanus]|uniref:sugar phosphate nucleotidyltransferase n=1 Tax=Bacillus mexicanus TaxID=2834415 RepID=UPI003D1B7923